ncbi:hypothetical protein GW17_00058531 [Ensete ventricosum]|nr:hypothetical protein GW17_00058531 [Ensete ventricosum]
MIMNLKERSHCVVNRNEDLTTIDFDGDVSLTEKEAVVLSITVKILTTIDFDGNGSLAEKEQTILLEQNAAEGWSPEDSAESATKGVVGRRVDLAMVSIGCFVFDRSVRPSLM